MVEPIALTEDVLFKKPDFVKSSGDSLFSEGIFVTRTAEISADGDVVVYTVPQKRVLFITNISLNGFNEDILRSSVFIGSIDANSAETRLLRLHVGFGFGSSTGSANNAIVHNYSIPVKVEENRTIIITKSGSAVTSIGTLCFQGYEVSKEIIK